MCSVQRIVRMNKTEDDEMDAEELTDEELKQVAGACVIASHHNSIDHHVLLCLTHCHIWTLSM